jgi:prepilin-type N-terminal cleavage/methylation domain-containing protein
MMFPRLRLINKNQKGFTLMELVVAIAITGIISGGITATMFQVFVGSARTSNHMIAVRQVQNAGYCVSLDAQMAQTVVLARDTDGFPLQLSWTDWDDNKVYQVTYTLEDMTGGSKQLQRSHSSDGTTDTDIIAQFIDLTQTKCELTGGGTFTLPDNNDTFTITGGAVTDSVTITVIGTGSVSASGGGGATYDSGTKIWTIPTGGTVTVKATSPSTAGVWTSANGSATVAITNDGDLDATITGRVLTLTVTASVGDGSSERSETRVYEIVPRPG